MASKPGNQPDLRSRGQLRASPAASAPNNRRPSQWEQAREATAKKAASAAFNVGRWFGVAGDEKAVHAMHMEYNRQKTLTRKQKGPVVSNNQLNQAKLALEESSSDEDEEIMRVKHMTRDREEALNHYRTIWTAQKKELKKPGWFGGEVQGKRRQSEATLQKKRKHTYKRDETLVAMQLQALPTFTPWFIYLVTLLQALIFVGMMAHAQTTNALAPFGLNLEVQKCSITPASDPPCPTEFDGVTQIDGVERYTEKNYLYGPTTNYLVSVGAKFTLCMRSDSKSNVILAEQRALECGQAPNICDNPGVYSGVSCCALPNGRKGMRSEADCTSDGGTWIYGAATNCNEDNDFIVFRPCCGYKRNVECMLTTKDHCTYVGGQWQEDQQLCSETLCLAPICKLVRGGFGITADKTFHNLPDNPNQWFRFFIPVFLHAGMIHAILLLLCQLYFGTQIEKQAGFLRMLLIYCFSGFGGYAISGIFASSTATVGCDPAVYGILAVHVIELIQNWQIVIHPWWELFKMLAIVIVSLGIGTLPFIDNWSHLGGFVFGLVAGIVFLPYINFGQWDLTRKRIMLAIAVPLLIVMTVIAFVYFYKVQSVTFCSWCKYIDCVPYTSQIDCGLEV